MDGAFTSDIDQTVIEGFAHGACFFFADMSARFFRDGGAVFAKDKADLFERCAFVQFRLQN